jgi:hypothetical protein
MKIRTEFTAAFLVAILALITAVTVRAEAGLATRIQNALQTWVVERSSPEKITGVAAYLSFGDPGPAIEALAGKVGARSDDSPVRQNTLFQIAAHRSHSPLPSFSNLKPLENCRSTTRWANGCRNIRPGRT